METPILSFERGSGILDLAFHFFFFLFMAAPWQVEVPRLGVKLELQLPADTTANTGSKSHM